MDSTYIARQNELCVFNFFPPEKVSKLPSLSSQIFCCLTLLMFTTPYKLLHFLTSEDIKHLGSLLPIFIRLRPPYIYIHRQAHKHWYIPRKTYSLFKNIVMIAWIAKSTSRKLQPKANKIFRGKKEEKKENYCICITSSAPHRGTSCDRLCKFIPRNGLWDTVSPTRWKPGNARVMFWSWIWGSHRTGID